MNLELSGRVVVVTGGSDGLGRALCRRLVDEGASVALCARNPDRLKGVGDELRATGGDVLDVATDMATADAVSRFADAVLGRWDHVDGLVNNAGRAAAGPVLESTDAAWEEDLALKLLGAVRLIRALGPHLSADGAVVNVLAIVARAPGAGSAPSSVSRAAGLALTKTLSKELGPRRVNAVLIGLIESGQWERRAEQQGVPVDELYQGMASGAGIPLGRVGRGEEFADTVSWLLSARSSYVSGSALHLDGGLSAVI